ncbi:hypothetical protein AB205_0123270 [Aquarana catesbeiana]|uniref:Uncharacterized protein n=1 Tax=Aquarana catesbeiana TaxID=8400 RepID=A0A2G9QEV2_AQUCT|nr:hypothetical protein AB205_0184470 [Aquarana catesbeiana]PIO13631.1 hypothetical protein AB205_0123270 [Aquarana catesbeiana]
MCPMGHSRGSSFGVPTQQEGTEVCGQVTGSSGGHHRSSGSQVGPVSSDLRLSSSQASAAAFAQDRYRRNSSHSNDLVGLDMLTWSPMPLVRGLGLCPPCGASVNIPCVSLGRRVSQLVAPS